MGLQTNPDSPWYPVCALVSYSRQVTYSTVVYASGCIAASVCIKLSASARKSVVTFAIVSALHSCCPCQSVNDNSIVRE